jgi:hypothetical protein
MSMDLMDVVSVLVNGALHFCMLQDLHFLCETFCTAAVDWPGLTIDSVLSGITPSQAKAARECEEVQGCKWPVLPAHVGTAADEQ